MKKSFASEFISTNTKKKYQLHIEEEYNGCVKKGNLTIIDGKETISIINFIPRFVQSEDYTENFGMQWNIFKKTQIDSSNLTNLTRDRFYSGTKWDSNEIKGKKILEAGCGAGRFTEVLLENEANLYSFDYSSAVESCYENNASDKLCLFQGDIYNIPFPENYFDKVFCYGVLQHTPYPQKAFYSLLKHLKHGGKVSIDIYLKDGRIEPWKSKYIWRPITTKMNQKLLLQILKIYIPVWLPMDTFIRRIPFFGRFLASVVPCWNYTGIINGYKNLVEWAIMDTFDALAPKYDFPQTKKDVMKWFNESPYSLKDIEVFLGGNGIIGNAIKK